MMTVLNFLQSTLVFAFKGCCINSLLLLWKVHLLTHMPDQWELQKALHTYPKWVLTIQTAWLFFSLKFHEIPYLELFHFTLYCGRREEEAMKSMLSLTQRKEKSQETLDFYTPVEIICWISKLIHSSSSFPKGTTHNLRMADLNLLVSNIFPFQYYVLLSLEISGDAVKAAYKYCVSTEVALHVFMKITQQRALTDKKEAKSILGCTSPSSRWALLSAQHWWGFLMQLKYRLTKASP